MGAAQRQNPMSGDDVVMLDWGCQHSIEIL
jgi:hypothetical protein